MAVGGVGAVEDGRRARRQGNRDAVVDALLALYLDGNLHPTTDEIAERAGLSPRSVFRYFDDVDDLHRAAIARQHERVEPMAGLWVDAGEPLAVRIERLVAQRVALFDAIGAVGIVSRLNEPFHPVIAAELREARRLLRRQLERVLAPELAELGERASPVLAAVDVLCSFEAYQLLRHDQRLSRARAAAALTETLTLLFSKEDR
jgi:AcrR family transcriptional regulator